MSFGIGLLNYKPIFQLEFELDNFTTNINFSEYMRFN